MFQPYNRLVLIHLIYARQAFYKKLLFQSPASSSFPLLPPKLQQFRLHIRPTKGLTWNTSRKWVIYSVYLCEEIMHILTDDYLNIDIISYCTVGFFPGD